MEQRKAYSIFYILLLTMTGPALCLKHEADDNLDSRQKRQIAVAPIAVYAGVAVSPWVWAALLAAYGISVLIENNVRKAESDNHSCANNRGWCRSSCFRYEYVDRYNSAVCGRYKCCRSR